MKSVRKPSYAGRVRGIIEKARLRPGLECLDVGCGIGGDLSEMAYFGARGVGVDVLKDRLESLKSLKNRFYLDMTGVCASADTLPFKSECFDVVMSDQFFEHTRDIGLALREQIRVLRKGGRLIIMQGNLLSPLMFFNLLILYCWKTHGKCGGLKWLFGKGRTQENYLGLGYPGKDEDVHSRFWWRRKIRQHPSLRLEELASLAESATRWGKLIGRLFGDIFIVCTKVK